MTIFPKKQFEGVLYEFQHLKPLKLLVPINQAGTNHIALDVEFGCHCFTEEFNQEQHRDHHRYLYNKELRAFDLTRYECSLQLPKIIENMLKGRVYNADESYTYMAQITIESLKGPQSYSVFFSLKKNGNVPNLALKMYVKSAYLKPLVAKTNAQGWRFLSLAGQISGAFPPKEKKPKQQKKKAP